MCSVANIRVQTRQRCNLVLLVDWLTGCWFSVCWFAGCARNANKYIRVHAMWYVVRGTHKKITFNSQFSRINVLSVY